MVNLSLREKIKFWMKSKMWIKEEIDSCINSDDLQLYLGIDINGIACSYFAAEKINNKVTITQISKTDDYYLHMAKKQTYIVGTEGIFYKVKGTKLRKILDKTNFSGIKIASGMGIIFIFEPNGKDSIARLSLGEIHNLSEAKTVKCIACNNKPIYFERDEVGYLNVNKDVIQVITEENGKYEYFYINENDIYCEDVYVDQYALVGNLLKGELVKAYNKQGNNVIISLVEGKMKIHFEFDELIKLDETYYMAAKNSEDVVHILKYEKEECSELGTIPKGELSNCRPICIGIEGLKVYKMKKDKGMILLLIYNDTVKYRFYEGAFDIKLSEPILMKDNNLIEIKAVTCIEKME